MRTTPVYPHVRLLSKETLPIGSQNLNSEIKCPTNGGKVDWEYYLTAFHQEAVNPLTYQHRYEKEDNRSMSKAVWDSLVLFNAFCFSNKNDRTTACNYKLLIRVTEME